MLDLIKILTESEESPVLNADLKSKHQNIKKKLDNPLINEAEVMRLLWSVKQGSSEDDELRSVFRKKKNMTNGMHFTEEEINKISSILSSIN